MANKNFKAGLDMLIQSTKDSEINKESDVKKEIERKVTVMIPENLKRKIKRYCVDNDITMKEFFMRGAERLLDC